MQGQTRVFVRRLFVIVSEAKQSMCWIVLNFVVATVPDGIRHRLLRRHGGLLAMTDYPRRFYLKKKLESLLLLPSP